MIPFINYQGYQDRVVLTFNGDVDRRRVKREMRKYGPAIGIKLRAETIRILIKCNLVKLAPISHERMEGLVQALEAECDEETETE